MRMMMLLMMWHVYLDMAMWRHMRVPYGACVVHGWHTSLVVTHPLMA